MLRKKYLLWKVHGFYIRRLFIQRGRNVWIYGWISWIVYSVVDLFDLYAVVLAVVFFSYLLEFNNSDICSFFDLLKNAIVKSRSSLQIHNLWLGQSKFLVDRIDNDVSSLFKDLFIDFIVPIVVKCWLFFQSILAKWKIGCVRFGIVVNRVVVIWSRLHFWKFERFGRWFAVDNSTSGIHLGADILLVASSHIVHPI